MLTLFSFQDIVSGDEIISDTYKLVEKEDAVYEVDCKKVTLGTDNIDIGANPSAEEAEEGVDDNAKQVIDVVHGFRLNFLGDEATGARAFPTKKDYQAQLKCASDLILRKLPLHKLTYIGVGSIYEESCCEAQGKRRR